MKNWKKFLVAGFATMTVALGGFGVANLNAISASAEANGLTMASGASIRITGGEISADTGVRFKAIATKELAASLQAASQNGAEIGVFMVPQKCISAYDEAKKTDATLDYFDFMQTEYGKTKESISDTYALSDLSTEKDNNLYVTLMSIKDVNYNLDYQAVAYYTLDGSEYVYTQPSDARRVAQVAHKALTDAKPEFEYTETQKASLGAIVGKAATLKADGGNVILNSGERVDFNELVASVTGAETALTVSSTEETGTALTLIDGAITAKPVNATNAVNESNTVSVKGYNGKLNVTFNVTTVPTAQTKTIGKSAVTAYAANVTANGLVNLPKGSYANESTNDTGDTDVPYVAFNGSYGAGNYAVVDFSGNNMPNFSFFTDMEGDVQNFLNRDGLFMSQMMRWENGNFAGTFANSYYIYGPTGWGGAWTGGGTTTAWCLHNSASAANYLGEQGNALTYNVMAKGGKQYRMVVGYDSLNNKATTAPQVSLTLFLLQKNAEGSANEYTLLTKAVGKTQTNKDLQSLTAGGIVIYGRPYEDTDLDKVHELYTTETLQTAMNEWLGIDDFITENKLTSYNAIFNGASNNVGVSLASGTHVGNYAATSTDTPYVAFNGSYGVGNYLAFDFTGNNLPNLSFFTDMTGSVENYHSRNGVFMTNNTVLDATGYIHGTISTRYYIYANGWQGGFANANGNALHNTGWAEEKVQIEGSNPSAFIYSVLTASANKNKQYRMVVGYDAIDTTAGKLNVTIVFMEKNEAGSASEYTTVAKLNGYEVTNSEIKEMSTAGGIVLYGRSYMPTAIDKIHPLYTSKTAVGEAIEGWTGTNPFAS